MLFRSVDAPWAAATQEELTKWPADQRKWVRVVPIPGCRSMPLLENPAAATAAIADFLD